MALERAHSDRPQTVDVPTSTVEVPRPVEERAAPKGGETQDDARRSAKDAVQAQFAEAETMRRIDELRHEGGRSNTTTAEPSNK